MNRRLTKLYADIDQRYEDQIDNILSVVVENESATRKLAKKAMKKFCSTNATDAQDKIVNARIYAAQIIADNEVFVSEPGISADCFENPVPVPVLRVSRFLCLEADLI